MNLLKKQKVIKNHQVFNIKSNTLSNCLLWDNISVFGYCYSWRLEYP